MVIGVCGIAVLGVGGTVPEAGISVRESRLPSLLVISSTPLLTKSQWLLSGVGWRTIVEIFGLRGCVLGLFRWLSPGIAGAGIFSLSFCSAVFGLLSCWSPSVGPLCRGGEVSCFGYGT